MEAYVNPTFEGDNHNAAAKTDGVFTVKLAEEKEATPKNEVNFLSFFIMLNKISIVTFSPMKRSRETNGAVRLSFYYHALQCQWVWATFGGFLLVSFYMTLV